MPSSYPSIASMIDPSLSSTLSHHLTGWIMPPLDGSHNINRILRFNYLHNSTKPLFVYANADEWLQYISWHSAVRATYRIAATLSDIRPSNSVVAICATVDSIMYWTYIYGILAAGHRPFPISPRNSAPIIAHLLKITNSSAIILDSDGALRKTAALALESLDESPQAIKVVLTARSFEQVFGDHNDPTIEEQPKFPMASDIDSEALILHSSGRFVKPLRSFT
jgi:acyl-CoA synthetase (AMP-forming)/AMP-acid ligase II